MNIMYFQRVKAALKQMQESWRNTASSRPGDWDDDGMPTTEDVKGASVMNMVKAGSSMLPAPESFDPEEFTKTEFAFNEAESKCVPWLMKQIEAGSADVQHAYLFEAKVNAMGRMLKESKDGKKPYRIKRVFGTDAFKAQLSKAERVIPRLREAQAKMKGKLREGWEMDGDSSQWGNYDANQYTEYAPLMGGYFFAQQYLHDMLKGHAYAFEAWNHNPLAHRIINGLSQYTLGRRFDWHINKKAKDYDKKAKVWEDFTTKINLRQRLSKYWIREKLIFGEMFLNIKTWQTLHPATIWEIITEPADITNVYYYYRSYPTQYQMFSGMEVKGAPGAKDVPSNRYIIEQIPYPQLLHLKSQCTSFEKRGRSTLFPILGWLKRVKDLYQAQIARAEMQSDYAWDVTIKGSQADVTNFQSNNSVMPRGRGNTFVHNEAVTRTPMPMATTGSRGGDPVVDNVLAFIATSVGMPKDFFNVISMGGGSRATALVGAEPFTKVIEDEQADWEFILHKIAKEVFEQNHLEYQHDDIEFVFPSVTKDTTSEAIKNIQIGKAEGLISNETAGEMYAQEMNITTYEYNDQQQQIKEEQSRGDVLSIGPLPPDGSDDENDGGVGDSPIAGSGKTDLQDTINKI